MAKRTKKDISSTSSEQMSIETVAGAGAAAAAEQVAETAAKTRKRNTKTGSSKKSVFTTQNAAAAAVVEVDDLELQNLLLQVDQMLTEMTQSKWLSSEWPSLEIDFGSEASKKK